MRGWWLDFHKSIAVADSDGDYGEPATVCHAVEENFQQIRKCLPPDEAATQLVHLEAWSAAACERLNKVFSQRKADGFVRECHGDMHLRNLAWVDGRPLVFDCIEFSPQLRWIDVISEIAFLVMDLQDRDQPRLAWRFLNTYLEHCGDYAGLAVLPFYLAYRAIVRAKVEVIRASQPGIAADEQAAVLKEFHAYLRLANNYTLVTRPVLDYHPRTFRVRQVDRDTVIAGAARRHPHTFRRGTQTSLRFARGDRCAQWRRGRYLRCRGRPADLRPAD